MNQLIIKDGLHKDPIPKNVTQVKAFIATVNYYGKFVPNITDILTPFYEMSKSSTNFSWSNECKKAFRTIKDVIASEHILVHFDPSPKIVL